MKVALFSTEAYDREFLTAANTDAGHDLTFYEPRLTAHTCALAAGFPAICAFVNDQLDAQVLPVLAQEGVGDHRAGGCECSWDPGPCRPAQSD